MALTKKAKDAVKRAVTEGHSADELIAALEASDAGNAAAIAALAARMDAAEAELADHESRIAALE